MRGTGFIDQYSAPCLLGPQSKNIRQINNLFIWEVGKKTHFSVIGGESLSSSDIEELKKIGLASFHYLSEDNYKILKNNIISKDKITSIILKIDEIDYCGNRNKTIRNYMNRYKKKVVEGDYRKIDDVKEIIDRWSDTSADKYFRDFSGKNLYFIKNGYHKSCENVFVYDEDKLISFGVASSLEEGYCTYVIGKALCKDYPGLSEFTDMKLYEKIFAKVGPFRINMGQAMKGLVFYKKKFAIPEEEINYHGKIQF
jgi:hypothetical protein